MTFLISKNFEIERFIDEIKKRPSIWGSWGGRKSIGDKYEKKKDWSEVVDLFGGQELEEMARRELEYELQKRWKGLRDCFCRELKRKIHLKAGIGPVGANERKSEYIYYKQLKFLKDVVTARGLMGQQLEQFIVSEDEEKEDEKEKEDEEKEEEANEEEEEGSESEDNEEVEPSTTFKRKRQTSEDEGYLIPTFSRKPHMTRYAGLLTRASNRKRRAPKVHDPFAQVCNTNQQMPEDEDSLARDSNSKQQMPEDEGSLIRALNNSIELRLRRDREEADEDKLFLLSLTNTLKALPPNIKMRTKIKMLTLLSEASGYNS